MKAEDTVLKTIEDTVWNFEKLKLDQAKISFKAGTKEVVEWIYNHGGTLDGNRMEWHEQLKEWGI